MNPKVVSEWGKIVVSAIVLIVYIVALGVAYYIKSDTMLTVLISVAATNATTVVGFWVGSSQSSSKKDDVLSNLAQDKEPFKGEQNGPRHQ